MQALDAKRNTSGVMDAISAEDIGKFPDANLAESLQRVTGVSVNRVEGEGSEVTIRGFSGQFNLVTLNGRQMPAADSRSLVLRLQLQRAFRRFALLRLFEPGVRGRIGPAGVQDRAGLQRPPAVLAARSMSRPCDLWTSGVVPSSPSPPRPCTTTAPVARRRRLTAWSAGRMMTALSALPASLPTRIANSRIARRSTGATSSGRFPTIRPPRLLECHQ